MSMKRSAPSSRIETLRKVRRGADTIEVRVITYPKTPPAVKRPPNDA
jgi:hypothetical protein